MTSTKRTLYEFENNEHLTVGSSAGCSPEVSLHNKRRKHTLSNDASAQSFKTCARCLSLEVQDLFSLPDPSTKIHHIARLGDLPDHLSTSQCAMCRLLYAVKQDSHGSRRLKGEYVLVCARDFWKETSPLEEQTFLCVARLSGAKIKPGFAPSWNLAYAGRESGVIALAVGNNIPDPRTSILCVQHVASAMNSLDFARRWIHDCANLPHAKCCQTPRSLPWPHQFTLISCEDRKLVHVDSKVKYAALSYVWGPACPQQGPFLEAGCLPSTMPRTIEDAVFVTRQCGINHLWVDRYCIDQSDAQSKHHQIRQMDLIYRNAFITIVDAAGADPNHGLSGISMDRSPSLSASIGSQVLAATLPPPQPAIRMSPWYQRAWTYQEAFFSTRRLVFTTQEVYWECRTTTRRESMFRDKFPITHGLFDVRAESFLHLKYQLSQYSRRQLSYQSDAIRAFEGIFHFSETQNFPIYHHQGIPLTQNIVVGPRRGIKRGQGTSQSEVFATGLCWVSREHGERRSDFPSWSWAGWTSSFDFCTHPTHVQSLQMRKVNPVLIHVRDVKGSDIDFDNYDLRDLTRVNVAPLTKTILIETHTIPINMKGLPRGCEKWIDHFMYMDPKGNFSGYFAVFESDAHRLEVALVSNSYSHSEATAPMRFSKHDGRGEIIGLVLGRHREEPKLEPYGECVFVVLVQAVGTHFERIGHMKFEPRMFRLISKHPPYAQTTERFSGENMSVAWQLCFGAGSRRSILLS